MEFSCTARHAEGHVNVALAGDIDLAIYPRLQAEAETWIGPRGDVIVDCSGVTFMDSMGLRVLARLRREVTEGGNVFTLADPSEPVRRVLELAGVEGLFGPATTRAPVEVKPAA